MGDPGMEPTLAETICAGEEALGEILVGARQKGPFTPTDAQKLRHCGQMIAHLSSRRPALPVAYTGHDGEVTACPTAGTCNKLWITS